MTKMYLSLSVRSTSYQLNQQHLGANAAKLWQKRIRVLQVEILLHIFA